MLPKEMCKKSSCLASPAQENIFKDQYFFHGIQCMFTRHSKKFELFMDVS